MPMTSGSEPPSRSPVRVAIARVGAVAGATLAASLLALLVLLPTREERLLVGRPGDAGAVSGLSLPSTYNGHPGRWSRGDARLTFPDCPLPAHAALTLATLPERLPDSVEITVNDARIQRLTLTSTRQTVDVPVLPRRIAGPTTIDIRSTATLRGNVPQGIFVERATLTTGGLRASLGVRPSTWIWLTCAFVALLLWLAGGVGIVGGASVGLAGAGGMGPWRIGHPGGLAAIGLAAIGLPGIGLAVATAVLFRAALLAHPAAVALAIGLVAMGSAIAVEDFGGLRGVRATIERYAWMVFVLGAAILVVLLLPDAFLHGRVLSQADMLFEYLPWRAHVPEGYRAIERPPLGDVPMLVYPFLAFTVSRAWSGVFPVWTSSIASGQPFLATYQSALLSPFTWLAVVVPLPQATVAIAAARLLVGGVGMFVFLRRLGLSVWAATFGGVTYLLNPFSVVWLEHPLAGVPPWLPWMGVAAEAAVTGRAWAIAMLALVTALTFVGGHPHTGLFLAGFGGAYAIVGALTTPGPRRWRALAAVGGGLALGGSIASVQVLPFLEYLSLSRGATMRTGYALNPFVAPASTLITTLVPNFLGHPSVGNFAGPTNYLEQQIYPGITTWLLAPLGVVAGARRWRTWFFACAAALAMLAMYGAPGMLQLVSVLPLLKAASLPRLAIIAIASLIVLASLGVDALLHTAAVPAAGATAPSRVGRAKAAATVGASAIGLIVAIAWTVATRQSDLASHALLDFATRWSWAAIMLIGAASLTMVAALLTKRSAPAGITLVAIAACDLLLFGRGFHPTLPPEQVFPPTPATDVIKQDHDIFRVLGLDGALLPNSAMVYGLQDVRGYDGLAVARYADLLDAVLSYTPHLHTAHSVAHAPLLDLLNVKYAIAPADAPPPDGWSLVRRDGLGAVWRNDRAYPRAWLVDGYTVLTGNDSRRALRDARVDGHRVAILEEDLPDAERPASATSSVISSAAAADLGRATILGYQDQRVTIETEAANRRLLVLMDVQYPGWSARVDDRPATIYRANFAFRAVPVPAGRHRVELVYRPASFYWGVALAGGALLVLLMLVLRERVTARS